jgi:hypothetical protein
MYDSYIRPFRATWDVLFKPFQPILFQKWQMGTVFLPDSIGYLLGTHFLGEPALRLGRWRVSAAALMLLGVSAALVSAVHT